MKKNIWLVLLFAVILVTVPLTGALAIDNMPPPIDPQSWKLNRDQTWHDFLPNPVIDWAQDLNPASLDNKFAFGGNSPNTAIVGGLILIEYLDRKFISRGELGSDVLGYYLFNNDGSGMQDTKTHNPMYNVPQLIAAEKGIDVSQVTDTMFAQWWADYLNKPQKINNYTGIDEFWREVSYGKWAVDLRPYGPFTIPYFEFETMSYDIGSNFQTYRDVPPSFRTGSSGTGSGASFDTQAQNLAVAQGVPFGTFDFFFLFHAGYAESGVWQEFGQSQFASRKDIPYELGPGPRMKQVEEFFTKNPEWLATYATRYSGTPSASFWTAERNKYDALVGEGKPEIYEFHLQQADWDWVNGYNDQTQRNTRYVNFTSWEAAVGEWSHAGSFTYNGRSIRRSTQGENNGMATFAHEFGHISGIGDNYGTPWIDNYSPATEPWELMSRGSFAGPFGDHARWTVPGIEAETVPVHFMQRQKEYNQFYDNNDVLTLSVQQLQGNTPLITEVVARNIPLNNNGFYPQLEKYGLKSPNYYKAIKLNFGSGVWADQVSRKTTGFTWNRNAATGMTVEVVQRTGYDSFTPDDGVIIARNGGSPFTHIIDSHLYDIAMIDYELNGEYTPYPMAHATQLFDAAFHAGKSFVDSGYYASEYNPLDPNYNQERPIYYDSNYNRVWVKDMIKPGSIFQWEPRNGREIVSGNTVNEFVDEANKLHFYVLEKHLNPAEYGEFLSYKIGILRTDGQAVGGELDVALAEIERETPTKVGVANFEITNTGDATDIIRVEAQGYLPGVVLNDLYAIEAGETITVPLYVDLPGDIRTRNISDKMITFTASSESNADKVSTVSFKVSDLIGYNYNVYMTTDQEYALADNTLLVDVMLAGDLNYTQFSAEIAYDANLLQYAGYADLQGWVAAVSPLSGGKVSVRSVPSANMILGESCNPDVKIVTLKFTVKPFSEILTDTSLSFATAIINPPAGVIGAGLAPALPMSVPLISPAATPLANVLLITGSEIEIDYPKAVPNDFVAKAIFDIKVDGQAVEWDYLSYFDFGSYATRGGVVNLRLKNALDVGEPRGRRRETAAESYLARTEHINGPIAAASLTVGAASSTTKTAVWKAFYTERSLGHMSRVYAYASAEAGNNGQRIRDWADSNNGNVFSATSEPLYTDEFIARQVAEGMHRFCGRSEFLTLPFVDSGFKALLVGAAQSVYEAPEFRELYTYGETTDTYTRTSIKATDVPGNFLGNGKFKKPFIVGTADDIMRHDSPVEVAPGVSARPRCDHFYFGEAFFDIYYEIGVKVGCPRFPLGPDNDPDDYRFDLHLERAYAQAKAEGKWPNTVMMNSVKDYYLYGAMIDWEFLPESPDFEYTTFPVNTRAELYEYDYDLYWALSGIYGKYEFWTGVGNLQGASTTNDISKYQTPWFWHNQQDNYGLPATANGTAGIPYEPLKIVSATVVAHNQIDVVFNREIKTVASVTNGANWMIYINGEPVTGTVGENNGYNWKSIRLTTNCTVDFATGLATSNAANRLDNGKPYGRYFAGFSQSDLDERSVANGGWILNNQVLGTNSLEFGEFVGVDEAIKRGADKVGKVEIAYIGTENVEAWDGSVLAKNARFEADKFRPWIGHAYRSPLTGLYIYLDAAVGDHPGYDAETVAMVGAQVYEAHLQNNAYIVYPNSAGGTDFDKAFGSGSGSFSSASGANQYSAARWDNGKLGVSSSSLTPPTADNLPITNDPVVYDRVGQRIADGAVRGNGGMIIAAGSVLGHHPGQQPQSTGLRGTSVGDSYRVEGWGGTTFQTEDVLVLRDYNLCRYRNEALIMHEGGHGIDSFTNGASNYAQNIYNDISAAWATAASPVNGARWADVDNLAAYCGTRSEYTSTLPTFYAGVMREQMMGVNDATWTPMSTRTELYRYDPYGFEVFKRIFYVGELHLWYENKIGDPDYRVIPEDWELLRDTYGEFSSWTKVDDLIQWGYSIPQVARYNPYLEALNGLPEKSQLNSAVKWVSWNVPDVWGPEPYREPSNPAYPNNRYDFVGGSSYFSIPDFDDINGLEPLKNQEHPFARPGGVKKPVRPAELEALVKPVSGVVGINSAKILSRPVLIQFSFSNYSGAVTKNNALNSFKLKINGKYTHFYLWDFKEISPGLATVTLRVDWPLEGDETVEVIAAPTLTTPAPEYMEEAEDLAVFVEVVEESIEEVIE